MNLEDNGPDIPDGEMAKLVTAATQMAAQVRQIKILVLIYTVASLVSIGWSAYFAANLELPTDYDHEPGVSEAGTAGDEGVSAGPSEDDPLPVINLRDASGRVWSNRDLDGKAVLLNFWTTWCAPCLREMPIFDEMQEVYGPKGFTVLAVSLDREGWDVVRPYLAERKFSYPVFVADESIERGFGRITSFPTTYFVRRDGTIDTKHVGGLSKSHIVRHIESLLEIKSEKRAETRKRSALVEEGGSDRDTESPRRADEVEIGDVNEFSLPKMLDFIPPPFPKDVRDVAGELSVELEYRVEADGSVHDIKVVRGLGVEFDKRMVEAVKRARFEPAKKAGKPISVRRRHKLSQKVNRVVRPYDPEE